jgi:hypothetical protein
LPSIHTVVRHAKVMPTISFLGFTKKPAKLNASALCRALGMEEAKDTDFVWEFKSSRYKVYLEDLRDVVHDDEYFEEIGWNQSWGIAVMFNPKGNEELFYKAFVATLMNAYQTKTVWEGDDDVPTDRMRLAEFLGSESESESEPEIKPEPVVKPEINVDFDVEVPAEAPKLSLVEHENTTDEDDFDDYSDWDSEEDDERGFLYDEDEESDSSDDDVEITFSF